MLLGIRQGDDSTEECVDQTFNGVLDAFNDVSKYGLASRKDRLQLIERALLL